MPSEARVFLIHSASGQALCKDMSGDCPPNLIPATVDLLQKPVGSGNYSWKLEVIKKDKTEKPSELYIRNDWHPQRFLTDCDGNLMLLGGKTSGAIWQVEYHEVKIETDEGDKNGKLVSLKNKHSGQYLTVMENQLKLGASAEFGLWLLSPAFGAFTPAEAAFATVCCTAGAAAVAGYALAASGCAGPVVYAVIWADPFAKVCIELACCGVFMVIITSLPDPSHAGLYVMKC